jgi:hypothetical protein
MNVKELRIGNLFYRIIRKNEIHLPDYVAIKIASVGLFESEYILSDQDFYSVEEYQKVSNKDLSGIPLNSEWLVKCGFKMAKIGGYEYFKLKECPALNGSVHSNGFMNFMDVPYPCQNVHQLQNLFYCMTGEELTFNN